MIRCLLIDDEPDSRAVLKHLLETHCPEALVLGEADGVATAIKEIGDTAPDLLFLDINLGNGDGFGILDDLPAPAPQVIFVTAFDSHALRAFQYSAVDYLLKPLNGSDLRRAVDKVVQKFRTPEAGDHLDVLMANIKALQASEQRMAIPTTNGLSFVFLRDILRFEANGAYTKVIMTDGRSELTSRSIREYEVLLPEGVFIRVHHSHIVNVNKIEKYLKERGGHFIIQITTTIEVAIRRREDFLKKVLK